MKSSAANLLTSVDSLFTTQEERDVAAQPRVEDIPIDLIDDFPNHPFKVRMDESMQEMVDSVKQHGVLVPAIIRPKEDGRYEMVAGHRRKTASELASKGMLPCVVRNLTEEEATIIMVDSNLQREQILPSEKAFAYKMKLDAMKRQAGRPSKENGATVLPHFSGKKSRELLAKQSGESHEQIRKFIRLTNLTPELLDLVDNSVLKEKDKMQIALRPAVELSYLTEQEQHDLHETMMSEDCTPSHVQAIKMRKFSEAGRLNMDVIFSIMQEEKPNQKEQFKIPKDRISKYFAPGTPAQKIEDTIVKALEFYRKRQREQER
ncbi:MAG: ParB/RepB/Spo0J family partition protein [Faecousia sp.]